MDANLYLLEAMVRERLDDARATARRRASRPTAEPPAAIRIRLGEALIALGRWLAAPAPRRATP